ncbi:MAG: bifunctional metallophosphatase/5'-nucleotidase [Solobacterium sp.]|nr:bifunctional metallophosphatase/5'-nucleotidase [Solobacterium sp.]
MKKVMKLIVMIVLMLCSACADTQESSADPAITDGIYIFYTSDVHCGVDDNLGFAKLKALVNDTKAEHENVLLADLGDYVQGGTIGALTRGSAIIELMNAMEYDIATVGNHEFDYGTERLGELLDMAEFDITLCNADYTGNAKSIFADIPPYIIKDFNGVKVAFIGVLTPWVVTSSTPKYFMEGNQYVYGFANSDDGTELAEKVQSAVDAARSDHADYVILLSHLGSVQPLSPNDSISLIRRTRGIDAVLDGHSHSVIIGDRYPNADGEDVILSSVGTKMENAGELIIAPDGSIDTLLISEYNREDEQMRQAIDQENEALQEILSAEAGTLEFDLPITDENGIRIVRSRETTAGNFVADAFRYAGGTDAALVNGGGVRAALEQGTVTYGDLLNVMPFGNYLCTSECTGQQILDALEYCSKETQAITSFDGRAAGEFGAFLQVSGLKYTIDTSVDSGVRQDENGMMTSIEGERRVKDVYILQNGEYVPLDPAGRYTVASTEYVLTDSGDGNTAFNNSIPLIQNGTPDIQVLIDYLESLGTVPDSYRQAEGRITVK